ncbi:MAG: chromate transporter [Lawsonibacter sp.]
MILLRLFYEFFKTGLFSVGGGMATIPFLQHMGRPPAGSRIRSLTTMIAVSESTPGPLGVNMATYVGYQTAGVPGGRSVATLGVITPGGHI